MKIETQNRLDKAIADAVESEKIRFTGENTDAIKISDNLILIYESSHSNEIAFSDAPRWNIVKMGSTFLIGTLGVQALNKARRYQIERIKSQKEDELTAQYNEIIDEIKGIE